MIAVILAFAAAGSGPFQTAPAFSPPSSQPSPPPHPPSNGGGERWGLVGESLPEVKLAYEREAKALRAEMHALQESDGGQLTAEHRAYLRKKANALLSDYRLGVRRMDPTAVNADGSKAH